MQCRGFVAQLEGCLRGASGVPQTPEEGSPRSSPPLALLAAVPSQQCVNAYSTYFIQSHPGHDASGDFNALLLQLRLDSLNFPYSKGEANS